MISFIVIGKNEGIKIAKCFNSILNFCSSNKVTRFEIIYIDSDSSDDSVEYAKVHCDKIVKISGDINAAVARNVGAKSAIGEVLFFIDGDMEIIDDFYAFAFNDNKLIYPFLSGYYINNYHDKNGSFLYREIYKKSKPEDRDELQVTTGGLFIISSDLWNKYGGMDTKYTSGEDLDFGLRLSRAGFKLLRINQPLAYHNTMQYNENLNIFNKNEIYARAILYRNHLKNKYIYKQILFRDPSLIILLFSLPVCLFLYPKLTILFYFFSVFFFSLISNLDSINKVPFRFIYQICRDFMNLGAILFYYPPGKTKYLETTISFKNKI